MKVLMLGWELPPHNSGGLGMACYQLCKSLSKQDIDIEFVLPYRADHNIDFMKVSAAIPQGVANIEQSGMAYDSYRYVLENGQETWLGINDQHLLYAHAVAKMAETREFDIVHAHDWLTFRAALRVKEKRGCPIILHVHSIESDRAGDRPGNPLVHEIESTALHLADRVVAVSEHTKRGIIRDYGLEESAVEVVHNSLNVEDLVPLDEVNTYRYLNYMKSIGYRVVTNVGRLTIQKGLPNLLMAVKKVIDKVPKTLVLIVGSGEQQYELMELAARIGIGANVLFADFQRGKRWRDAFAIGDLFVMPSITEPFGLTPLESIGYGTPALVSKQSGVSEVISNVLKVDYWDIDEMANQISAVMMSDVLRDELASNGLSELSRMSWDISSDKLVGIYNSHLAGASL
ncbi:MAG: glycosyltransferase family 4 protein [Candidatus Saccharimonadales bacterium]